MGILCLVDGERSCTVPLSPQSSPVVHQFKTRSWPRASGDRRWKYRMRAIGYGAPITAETRQLGRYREGETCLACTIAAVVSCWYV
jgi:hypothetical protein